MSSNIPFRRSDKGSGTLLTSRPPQVNLLPPEARAARAFGVVRRLLVYAMLGSVVLSVAIGLYAVTQENAAARALAAEEERTQELLAQQAQYSEVPTVLAVLADARFVREFGMATDVDWPKHLRAIAAVLPEDVSLDRLTVETNAPLVALSDPQSVLSEPGAARITFGTRSSVVQDTVALLDALENLPGFRDAFFTQHPVTELDGSVFYEVEATVELDPIIYSGRFVEAEEDEEYAGATEEDASDDEGDE